MDPKQAVPEEELFAAGAPDEAEIDADEDEVSDEDEDLDSDED